MPRKSDKNHQEEISFEEALAKLETIVNELEMGELSLEDSLSRFAEGVNLSQKCLKKLNAAEKAMDLVVNQSQEVCIEKELTFTVE